MWCENVPHCTGAQSIFYTFDPQGSVSQRLGPTGDALSTHLFTAHGVELTAQGAGPHGYKARWGYYSDGETGLQLLTHRYYDPQTGRFLTRDPIGYEGGINLYGYVRNNAPNRTDELGLYPSISPNDFSNPFENGRGTPPANAGADVWLYENYGWLGDSAVWVEFLAATERSKQPCKPIGERWAQNISDTNGFLPGPVGPSLGPGLNIGAVSGGAAARLASEPNHDTVGEHLV